MLYTFHRCLVYAFSIPTELLAQLKQYFLIYNFMIKFYRDLCQKNGNGSLTIFSKALS